jgi:hypothetical protein
MTLQIVASRTVVIDATGWGYGWGYDTFIVQASLTIVTYDYHNILESRYCIHNTSFSSELTNLTNMLKRLPLASLSTLVIFNTLAYWVYG